MQDAWQRLWRAGRDAWPTVELDLAVFAAHVRAQLGADGAADRVERLDAAGLYLACACAHGIPSALSELVLVLVLVLALRPRGHRHILLSISTTDEQAFALVQARVRRSSQQPNDVENRGTLHRTATGDGVVAAAVGPVELAGSVAESTGTSTGTSTSTSTSTGTSDGDAGRRHPGSLTALLERRMRATTSSASRTAWICVARGTKAHS